MADKSNKTRTNRFPKILDLVRGNFDFNVRPEKSEGPVAYGKSELISSDLKTKILTNSFRAVDPNQGRVQNASSLISIVQSSLNKVGQDRLENRKILELMPEVAKAARLMVASIFAPNDLSKQNIKIVFDAPDISENLRAKLSDKATEFFQTKLNLKTQSRKWVYQFGYETGACVFAIIPLNSMYKIQEESFIGTESYKDVSQESIVNNLAQESLFGFSNSNTSKRDSEKNTIALENLAHDIFKEVVKETKKDSTKTVTKQTTTLKDFIKNIIAQENLSLTDNPQILRAGDISKKKRKELTKNVLSKNYSPPTTNTIQSVSSAKDAKDDNKLGVVGNPIYIKLPPESVTIIHTPGDPSDHQGYLVLLDSTGTPINALEHQQHLQNQIGVSYNQTQTNIFNQVYSAYGLNQSNRMNFDTEIMNRIYTQVVTEHLKHKLENSGFRDVELGGLDSIYRCMFNRFLQAKQTRILFLPKELVTYMTFSKDEKGYGISILEGIKFNLGMKMTVQISRTLAAIKAAMDKRRINIKFTENMMEQPETIFQDVIRQYAAKSTISFSTDPNIIQSQIADKAISITGTDIPGMESFELTNEPDQRSSSFDFDSSVLEYIDKGINNGLDVPAAAMNSLDENDLARAVSTTNLFFAMTVSTYQDIVIEHISDLIQKYARYSEEFLLALIEIIPQLRPSSKSSTDEKKEVSKDVDNDEANNIPEHYNLEELLSKMRITLPQPNVAPSKAQFESLDAMTSAITSTMNALFPNDLTGADDRLTSVITFLRAKFTSMNIRAYLENSGMNNIEIPDSHFAKELSEINNFFNSLYNVYNLLEDKAKLDKPLDSSNTVAPGY